MILLFAGNLAAAALGLSQAIDLTPTAIFGIKMGDPISSLHILPEDQKENKVGIYIVNPPEPNTIYFEKYYVVASKLSGVCAIGASGEMPPAESQEDYLSGKRLDTPDFFISILRSKYGEPTYISKFIAEVDWQNPQNQITRLPSNPNMPPQISKIEFKSTALGWLNQRYASSWPKYPVSLYYEFRNYDSCTREMREHGL